MRHLAALALFALTACGAAGPPQAPQPTGITITGEASMGITSTATP